MFLSFVLLFWVYEKCPRKWKVFVVDGRLFMVSVVKFSGVINQLSLISIHTDQAYGNTCYNTWREGFPTP